MRAGADRGDSAGTHRGATAQVEKEQVAGGVGASETLRAGLDDADVERLDHRAAECQPAVPDATSFACAGSPVVVEAGERPAPAECTAVLWAVRRRRVVDPKKIGARNDGVMGGTDPPASVGWWRRHPDHGYGSAAAACAASMTGSISRSRKRSTGSRPARVAFGLRSQTSFANGCCGSSESSTSGEAREHAVLALRIELPGGEAVGATIQYGQEGVVPQPVQRCLP